MVIVIHQSASTKNALSYNEEKTEQRKAVFFDKGNTPSINPFAGSKNDRWQLFADIEARNTRVKQKGLHISVNPTVNDLVKLGSSGIRTEIKNLMEHLGYGNQPYFVYKHADLDRTHFHIVSTRIDQHTGKKIKDNYEKEKVQRFIKLLEQKYELTKEKSTADTNLKFTAKSGNLKQNLESLFSELNQMGSITTKELYDKSLGLFNVEVRKSGRGHVVFITDGNGNPVRFPIRLSDFKERPKYYIAEKVGNSLHQPNQGIDKFQLAQLARDLNRLVEKSKFSGHTKKQHLRKNRKGKQRKF